MITDSELLMMIHECNEDALTYLINRYLPIIKLISKKYTSCFKYLEIYDDEVYNEGLKAIEVAINNYNEYSNASFNTYVSKIIDHSIKNLIKRYNQNKHVFLNKATLLSHEYNKNNITIDELSGDNKNNPEDIIINNNETNELISLLKNNLSPKDYKIIMMKNDNMSDKEIAKALNMDVKQVYNALYRIRNKLKKVINKNA